jgi:hypothetical protein
LWRHQLLPHRLTWLCRQELLPNQQAETPVLLQRVRLWQCCRLAAAQPLPCRPLLVASHCLLTLLATPEPLHQQGQVQSQRLLLVGQQLPRQHPLPEQGLTAAAVLAGLQGRHLPVLLVLNCYLAVL